MDQQDDQRRVRFEGNFIDQDNSQRANIPLIGVNDELLDPSNDVRNALTEDYVLLHEDSIVDYSSTEDPPSLVQLLECINIELLSHKNPVYLNQMVPLVLQLGTKKVSKLLPRAPIDLICVVDASGSMIGRKINLVKDSLRYLMKILAPEDRICIVIFTTVAHIMTPWTRNTLENKAQLKKTILELKGIASTNISDGMKKAIWMLKNRKQKNPVSCLFLLSDGQDDYKGADLRVQELLNTQQIDQSLSIHCFGYGSDHDAYVMNRIAKFRNGNFYFIENLDKVSEYFILAMSGMLSVFAEDINLVLTTEKGCSIVKGFGEGQIWQKKDDHTYQIKMNYLLWGENKDYVVELQLNHPESTQIQLEITGCLLSLKQTFSKQKSLKLMYTDDQEGDIAEIVEINYQRAKAGVAIGEACQLSQSKQYEQAISVLDQQIQELKSSSLKDQPILKLALEDMEKSKLFCKPKIFELEGEAFLMKKERNHIARQSSLTNLADWNEDQQTNMALLKNNDLQLSACGSLKESDSEASSLPDFDYQNLDPKTIIRQLLQMKRFDEEDDSELQGNDCKDSQKLNPEVSDQKDKAQLEPKAQQNDILHGE